MANFQTIWNNHPGVTREKPLLNVATYENQCAVNVAAALMRSGYDLSTFRGTRSWQKDAVKYPLRAEELVSWLDTAASKLPSRAIRFTGKQIADKQTGQDVFKILNGKTGILFFKNYWGPGRQGDHIDLWNGSRMTALSSWVRVQFGISLDGYWSDYLKAEEAMFWNIP
ncbi:type VI secretion system amidase effector protein Tae4 [Acidovorax sp. SUPP1855]|uniref:type VI secretion system amidase effector protein Tae4 n=1 Tax=Acidovorax sp. SUPP1855 TaxID=431774 RepID=UPI0023DE45D8|nr:type VI secretion system amidase effector protein Tae4 [Acidovorax sp. SUPP1855]GKS82873.1 type VI secretion system amidase effector protein Tae4 [Acidovorax sp. SUPP1855]